MITKSPPRPLPSLRGEIRNVYNGKKEVLSDFAGVAPRITREHMEMTTPRSKAVLTGSSLAPDVFLNLGVLRGRRHARHVTDPGWPQMMICTTALERARGDSRISLKRQRVLRGRRHALPRVRWYQRSASALAAYEGHPEASAASNDHWSSIRCLGACHMCLMQGKTGKGNSCRVCWQNKLTSLGLRSQVKRHVLLPLTMRRLPQRVVRGRSGSNYDLTGDCRCICGHELNDTNL